MELKSKWKFPAMFPNAAFDGQFRKKTACTFYANRIGFADDFFYFSSKSSNTIQLKTVLQFETLRKFV